MEQDFDRQDDTQEKQLSPTKQQLLRAALNGEGIDRPLMIGSEPAEKGVTFEGARDELYQLIEDGLVELDNKWRPKLTQKGLEALASL
jgi:predicted transcriptional regulator